MRRIPFLIYPIACDAGEANVLGAEVKRTKDGQINIRATVQHDDEGWKHYADGWEVLDMEGNVLDTRVLMHPHSHEPFTRSLPAAKIPPQIKKVRIRAHDTVHGYGGKELVINIPEP